METNAFHGYWRDTFRHHIIGIERELENSRFRFSGELVVYLAGMVARELDTNYKQESKMFLLESPEQMDEIVKQHILFLGQNAIIVTYSKINAEHLTYNLAVSSENFFKTLELRRIAKLFSIASTFSHYSGNHLLGKIFSTIAKNLHSIVEFLEIYLCHLDGKLPELEPIPEQTWKKFGKEKPSEKIKQVTQSQVQINRISFHYIN